MSFWLDDDDDDGVVGGSQQTVVGSSQGTAPASAAATATATGDNNGDDAAIEFRCNNCGGTEFYEDDDEIPVCSNCFTQSQQHSQMSQGQSQLDYEEVMGLAAKTRTGGLARRAGGGATGKWTLDADGRPTHWRKKLPLEDIDKSKPLPNLELCITALQTVIYKCVEHLAKLIELGEDDEDDEDDEEEKRKTRKTELHKTVRTLWNTYLRSWADGAQYYGTLYPQIRFSFRDYFFSASQRQMIFNTISYRNQQQDKEGRKQQDDDNGIIIDNNNPRNNSRKRKRNGSSSSSGSDSSSSDDNEEDEEVAASFSYKPERPVPSSIDDHHSKYEPTEINKKKKKHGSGSLYIHQPSMIKKIVRTHVENANNQNGVSYREAALTITPSMNLVAALLFLAASPFNGQITVNQLCHWISCGSIPLANAFRTLLTSEQQTELDPINQFFKLHLPPTPLQLEALSKQLAIACRLKYSTGGSSYNSSYMACTNISKLCIETMVVRTVSERGAPVVAARVCCDLHLGQPVLNRTLAIMGIDVPKKLLAMEESSTSIVPKAMPKAHPKLLYNLQDVVAVIAIACFLDPTWRTWKYELVSNNKPVAADGAAATAAAEHRFIPLNDGQFRLLRNGPELEGYLDYIQQFVLDERKSVMSDYLDMLQPPKATTITTTGEKESTTTGSAGVAALLLNDKEGSNKNKSLESHSAIVAGGVRSEEGEHQANKKSKNASISSINTATNNKTKKTTSIIRSSLTEADPHRRLLIEFLAYGTRLEPDKLQLAVDNMLKE